MQVQLWSHRAYDKNARDAITKYKNVDNVTVEGGLTAQLAELVEQIPSLAIDYETDKAGHSSLASYLNEVLAI